MSSKSKIIIIGIFLIILMFASIMLFLIPKIKIEINGNKNITINIGEEYNESGAKAYLKSLTNSKSIPIEINGNVDNKTPGKYVITYRATYNNMHLEAVRIVNVIDAEKPIITLNKPIVICEKNNLVEIDAKAIDNFDGDISGNIKYQISGDKVSVFVTDSSNNRAEIVTDLKYNDNEKPTITLEGNKTIYLNIGDTYIEPGATAYDSCDGNITDKIEINSNVDTNISGEYEIIYKVSDSINNESIVKRNVIVSKKENNKYKVTGKAIIYLTFDDGPGQYTDQILDILEKYNIKATFFVTNQFPKYQYLIKKEYENGHMVAIHTYSHKWSIYDSVDAYLKDFNKIQEIVIAQTGVPAKYFRFPGGSSNTVSRSHSKGIMTKLSKIMKENGYTYFDWTFDSCDTCKKNSKEDIINNVKNNLKGNGEYIILMHDIKKNTLASLPTIIEYGLSNGYTFSPINENTPICHFRIAN